MALSNLIRSCPLVHDHARGAEAVAGLPWADGAMRELLEGIASCSPYLAGLMQREGAWLEEAVSRPPQEALEEIFAALAPGASKQVARDLRQAKRRVALLVGVADCGGVWALHDVTRALSRFADLSVDVAMRTTLAPLLARGKFPGQGESDLESCAGLVALAMGKGGAFELNYSSDIDLICLVRRYALRRSRGG